MGRQNDATAEVRGPQSLTERLEAEARAHQPDGEAAPSSMAERFAPEPAPTSGAPKASLLQLQASKESRIFPRPARMSFVNRVLIALFIPLALIPSLALAALYWRDSVGLPDWVPIPAALAERPADPPLQEAMTASMAAETVLPKRNIEVPAVALTLASEVSAEAGKETQFPIALDADHLPLRSIISIRGLPEGASFSAGRPYGDADWSLRPDEIGDLILNVPSTASGESNVTVDLIAADGSVIASNATRLAIKPDPKAALISRPDDAARIDEFVAHGHKMIEVGYLAGARGYYKRAAEAGSADAALALGATYDPSFIAEIGAQGIQADLDAARSWYERARTLGSSEADDHIAALARAVEAAKSMPAPQPVSAAEEGTPAVARATMPKAAPEPQWVVISSAVNVRAEPTPDGETLKIAQAGMRYRATGRKGKWVQVTDPKTSEVGWVYSRFIASGSAP
jgi:SH3 domain-containing protein